MKKNASESRRLLVEVYGDNILSNQACSEWFRRFKSGDFDLSDKERGRPPKKFNDADLQALLDEDDAQTQEQLANALNVTQASISTRLHAMGKIQKATRWVPYERKS